jgi:hypothetical protein
LASTRGEVSARIPQEDGWGAPGEPVDLDRFGVHLDGPELRNRNFVPQLELNDYRRPHVPLHPENGTQLACAA